MFPPAMLVGLLAQEDAGEEGCGKTWDLFHKNSPRKFYGSSSQAYQIWCPHKELAYRIIKGWIQLTDITYILQMRNLLGYVHTVLDMYNLFLVDGPGIPWGGQVSDVYTNGYYH